MPSSWLNWLWECVCVGEGVRSPCCLGNAPSREGDRDGTRKVGEAVPGEVDDRRLALIFS